MLTDLQPKNVEKLIDDNSVILIDVRREDEWRHTGVIKNAYLMTFFDAFGNHDANGWLNKLNEISPSKSTQIVLICAHANRTRTIGNFLLEQGYSNVAHLSGGMAQWQMEQKETIPYKNIKANKEEV